MKIVNIIQRYPPAIGGAEVWCKELNDFLSKLGCNIEVLTLNIYHEEEYWREPPVENCIVRFGQLEYDGRIKVRRFNRTLSLRHNGPHSFQMYFKMIKYIRDADIVHLHTFPYFHNFVGYFIAKLCGKKIICTPHFHPGHPLYETKMNYWLLKKCDFILTVSEYEKEYFLRKGINVGKIIITGNGINIKDYSKNNFEEFKKEFFAKYNITEKTKIILFIGRKTDFKGLDLLIEAVKQIREQRDIRLVLVGPQTEWFNRLYSELSEKDKKNIIDIGLLPYGDQSKVNLLHLSSLLVLPSKHEAFGIVFLEAWACGVPVIGADTGAVASVIGNSGLTFKQGDINDLRKKIEIILDDPELAKNMASRGKDKVINKYNWDIIGKKIYNCYQVARNNKLKILLVSSFFPPHCLGGAEIVAYEQARILKELGHDVMVFCGKLNDLSQQYKFTYEQSLFKISRVNLHSSDLSADRLKLENVIIQNKFRKVLLEFSPDIIHFHNLNCLPVKLIDEASALGIPAVATLHDYWPICIKNIMIKDNMQLCDKDNLQCFGCKEFVSRTEAVSLEKRNYLMKASFDKVSKFIAPTQYVARTFIRNGFSEDKMKTIGYGIDINRFKRIYNGKLGKKLRFGFVGYMGDHKGIEYLIRAFYQTKSKEKAILYLVGEGERLDYYKNLSRNLMLNYCIKFVHKISNQEIQKIYKKIDVLVIPSIWPETTSVSILEAMAAGKAVIASSLGGMPEFVEDKITGLLFNPKDISDLSEKIEFCISNPAEVKAMGRAGLESIKQFDLENQVNKISNLYMQVLKNENIANKS